MELDSRLEPWRITRISDTKKNYRKFPHFHLQFLHFHHVSDVSEALEMVEDAFLRKYQPAPGHCRGHTHFGIRRNFFWKLVGFVGKTPGNGTVSLLSDQHWWTMWRCVDFVRRSTLSRWVNPSSPLFGVWLDFHAPCQKRMQGHHWSFLKQKMPSS